VHDPDSLRDWLFVKPSKRLLLEALLREPTRAWTRTELAARCEQHAKARIDRHLGPLLEAGVIERQGTTYTLRVDEPVVEVLRRLLEALGVSGLPER